MTILHGLWQGCQFWNRTFEEKLDMVDVAEIYALLNEQESESTDE